MLFGVYFDIKHATIERKSQPFAGNRVMDLFLDIFTRLLHTLVEAVGEGDQYVKYEEDGYP